MKDIHTYGKEMARNGRTKDIYKGTFVCIQTLGRENYVKFEDPKQPTVRFRLLSDFVLLGSQLKSIHSKSTVERS